jgi:hypothetical protein
MMGAMHSSKTSVLTIATQRRIPKDAILHGYRSPSSYFTGISPLTLRFFSQTENETEGTTF